MNTYKRIRDGGISTKIIFYVCYFRDSRLTKV